MGAAHQRRQLRTNVGNKVRETLITLLADQWKQIGANVATKPVQFPQLVTPLGQSREFEMILLGILEGLDPDTTQLWHSKSIGSGALNGAGYKNAKVDDLLDQAVKTLDREKRKGLYQQVQQILMEDLPAPLVTFPRSNWGRKVGAHEITSGMLQGSLGQSMVDGTAVSSQVFARLPNTIFLTVTAILLGIAISIPLGVLGALRRGSKLDHFFTAMSVGGVTIPAFWLGLLLILFFAVRFHDWGLPFLLSSGIVTPFTGGDLFDRLAHLVMPAVVLSFGPVLR